MDIQNYLVCSVCGQDFGWNYHCNKSHEDICHGCSPGFVGSYGYYDHPDPEAPADQGAGGTRLPRAQGGNAREPCPPTPSTLTMREVAAVSAYTAHLLRTVGAENLMQVVTEDEEA